MVVVENGLKKYLGMYWINKIIQLSYKFLVSYLRQTFSHLANLFKFYVNYPLSHLNTLDSIIGIFIACLPALIIYNIDVIKYQLIDHFMAWLKLNITLGHIISVVTVLLATVGWIVTVRANRKLSRKQHTVNILLNHSFSKDGREHVMTLYDRFPGDEPLDKITIQSLFDARKDKKSSFIYDPSSDCTPSYKAVYASIRSVLNYYEFLAIAIKLRDIDAIMMKDFFRDIICRYCEKTNDFISYCNSNNPKEYENLIALYKIWKPSKTFPINN